ncbi:MAG: hypothetical protein Q9N68_07760 [Gammaproteobacteria bacterium]|nr:hypothetical protein [Gammaproteobacteria bacterium]
MNRESKVDQAVDLDLEETLLDADVDLSEALRTIREQGVDFLAEGEEALPASADETVVDQDLGALKEALVKIRSSQVESEEQHKLVVPAPDFVLDEGEPEPEPESDERFHDALAKLRQSKEVDSDVDRTLVEGDQLALQEALAKIREGGF